jgi:hypothetical protein
MKTSVYFAENISLFDTFNSENIPTPCAGTENLAVRAAVSESAMDRQNPEFVLINSCRGRIRSSMPSARNVSRN